MKLKTVQYDTTKLRSRIIEKYGSCAKFSQAMEIPTMRLSSRMTGKSNFTLPEISRATPLLGLEENDIPEYFFKITE